MMKKKKNGKDEKKGDEKKKPEKEDGVVVVEKEVESLKHKASEVLGECEKGFEKWVKNLRAEASEEIVRKPECGDSKDTSLEDYFKWAQAHETTKVCSSCRWMRRRAYAARHRTPAKWWPRRKCDIFRSAPDE